MKLKKLCWHCKHCTFEDGCGGYSEYTPGWDASISCKVIPSHSITLGNVSGAEFKKFIEKAGGCEKFEMAKG